MQLQTPVISIITPVYNTEKYLNRCIRSILDQTFTDLELILVDDGSTDSSPSICDRWAEKDDRVVVVHQDNRGAGAARNRGLEIARGRYIGFVDSDDWVDAGMYAELLSGLNSNPEIDIAECGITWTRKRNAAETTDKRQDPPAILNRIEALKVFFRIHGEESNYSICTKLIRREILKDFRFVEGTVSEDVMASYYFYTHSRWIAKVPAKYYCYYQNDQGVTRNKASKKDLEYINAFGRIREDIGKRCRKLYEYADICYIRAHFTILSKMRLYGFDKKDEELRASYRNMKSVVRKNFFRLMKWKMPVSRKILLMWVCI